MRKNLWLSENASSFQRKAATMAHHFFPSRRRLLCPKSVSRKTQLPTLNGLLLISRVDVKDAMKLSTFNPRDGLLLGHDSAALCKWLSVYVAEAKKQDSSPFPPKSLYMLLAGILRHMCSKNPLCPNFLDNKQLQFVSLHDAMDNVFRKLRVEGVQANSKSTEAFTKKEICQLWDSGTLSTTTPKGLLCAVFFLNGISFCLRGGEEHRNLKLSQIKHEKESPRYVYTELASKNRSGSLAQLRVKNESVTIYSVSEAGDMFHVSVLDLYFSKLPKEAIERDVFYLQPVSNVKRCDQPWYTTTPVGKNTLARMVKC